MGLDDPREAAFLGISSLWLRSWSELVLVWEIILLFMTVFEMRRILTDDKRTESLLGTFMIGLLPAIHFSPL